MSLKCFTAFAILGTTIGTIVYWMYKEPVLIAVVAISLAVSWAFITAIKCLTSEGS